MRKGLLKRAAVLPVAVLVATVAAEPAVAYVGPGAGLGMLGSLVAVIGVVLLALFGVVLYPMRLLLKSRRKKAALAADNLDDGSSSAPPPGSASGPH